MEDLFNREGAMIPVVLERATGERVILDKIEQADFGPTELVVRRRTTSRVERLKYSEIAKVYGLEELPPPPGAMGYAEFHETLPRFKHREPFRPFVIELTNGESIPILVPTGIAMAGRFASIYPKDQPRILITYDQVARIADVELVAAAG
jgi:hypothetical protein